MSDFGFLRHLADKAKMLKAIDLLPEGACAIIITDSCMHDYDDDQHTPQDCDLKDKQGNICDWRFMGPITTMKGIGMLSFAQHAIFITQHEALLEDEDE
jgi:hypothetical protein